MIRSLDHVKPDLRAEWGSQIHLVEQTNPDHVLHIIVQDLK